METAQASFDYSKWEMSDEELMIESLKGRYGNDSSISYYIFSYI